MKEKKYFIDKKYTLSFVTRFLGAAGLCFLLFGLSLFVVLYRRLGVSYLSDIANLNDLQVHLPLILSATVIIQGILLSLGLFLLSLWWAHAISGPLIRFRKYLKMLSQAPVNEKIAFRREDKLHGLAAALRELQERAQSRNNQLTYFLGDAQKLIDEYESLIKNNATPAQLKEKLKTLRTIYEKIDGLFQA